MKRSFTVIQRSFGATLLALLFLSGGLFAQPEGSHYVTDGSVVGDLALAYRTRNPNETYMQPVKFILPGGAKVAAAVPNEFQENQKTPGFYAMRPGEVYRFKFFNIDFHEGIELFPSVEMLNRTFPPEGKALDFPVEIAITQEDLEYAISGKLVTRVVYLERPDNAIPLDASTGEQPLLFDAPPGLTPVAVAETRGKIMAIIRIGCRIPEEEPNPNSSFYFGLPKILFLDASK